MKSALAVAAISLAGLFTIFHSCHGLICYSCHSMNFENKECENITNNEFLHNYGPKVKVCMKIVTFRRNFSESVSTDRLLNRGGFETALTEKDILNDAHKRKRYRVLYSVCTRDRCNGF